MNGWLPVVAGLAGLVAIIAAGRLFPRSWFRAELRRRYGAKPSGAYSVMTRRDLVRRAVYSAIASVVLVASALVLLPISARFANGSKTRLVLEAYFFTAFVLGAVAALAMLVTLGSIASWRPRMITLSFSRALDLAEYFELMRKGALEAEAWRDFSAVRFDRPEIEAIRTEYVSRVGPVARTLSDEDADWLRRCVLQLLAQTFAER